MKKISILLLASLIVFSSCESLLEEDPRASVTRANFYKTQEDAEAAIMGAYAIIDKDYYGINYYRLEEVQSDYLNGRGTQVPVSAVGSRLDQTNINRAEACWQTFYSGINRANSVLDNVSGMKIDESVKKRILAEAYYLRAQAYFNLVRGWGAVPLRLHEIVDEESIAAPRAPVDSVYKVIISDCKNAIEGLPESVGTFTGRASKYAAKMLLAQAYLTTENWTECAQECEDIISSGRYSLVLVSKPTDFYNLFTNSTSSEDIMSVHHAANWRSEVTIYLQEPNSPPYNYNSAEGVYAWLPDTTSFIGSSWDKNDLRKSFNLHTHYTDPVTGQLVKNKNYPVLFSKFITTKEGDAINSIPIFRYTEAFLMYAEAACMAEGAPTELALERLNMIKRRAYGKIPTISAPAIDYPTGLTKEQFRDIVLKERGYEFINERRRWWDLSRTGKLVEAFAAVGRTFHSSRYFWPIPQAELQNNPALTPEDQNPGY
jgi:hypothetical protein